MSTNGVALASVMCVILDPQKRVGLAEEDGQNFIPRMGWASYLERMISIDPSASGSARVLPALT